MIKNMKSFLYKMLSIAKTETVQERLSRKALEKLNPADELLGK